MQADTMQGQTNNDQDGRTASLPVKARWAVPLLERHLAALPHPAHTLRLVQFAHDSAGLRIYKRQISEAIIGLIESNGGHVCNGVTDAITLLRDHGYTITKGADIDAPESHTDASAE